MKLLLSAYSVVFFCSAASAFHPLITEDTTFLGKDVRQAAGAFEYSASEEGPDTYSTGASAELTYGLYDDLDLLVAVPWQGWTSHGVSESGLGDVALAAKFAVARRGGWTFALKPGFSLPAGNESRSLGAGKGGIRVDALAGLEAGPARYYLNAGYFYNRNSVGEEENILRASAAAVYALSPKFSAAADLALETNAEKGAVSHPAYSLLGLVWSPLPALDLDAGVRLGLTGSADDLGLLAGITLRL